METVQEVAAEVLAVIPNYRRWAKGTEDAFNGTRRCILGALLRVGVSPPLCVQFQDAVISVVKAEYPKCNVASVLAFNDDDDIRYTDVRRVLEKVRALLSRGSSGAEQRHGKAQVQGSNPCFGSDCGLHYRMKARGVRLGAMTAAWRPLTRNAELARGLKGAGFSSQYPFRAPRSTGRKPSRPSL